MPTQIRVIRRRAEHGSAPGVGVALGVGAQDLNVYPLMSASGRDHYNDATEAGHGLVVTGETPHPSYGPGHTHPTPPLYHLPAAALGGSNAVIPHYAQDCLSAQPTSLPFHVEEGVAEEEETTSVATGDQVYFPDDDDQSLSEEGNDEAQQQEDTGSASEGGHDQAPHEEEGSLEVREQEGGQPPSTNGASQCILTEDQVYFPGSNNSNNNHDGNDGDRLEDHLSVQSDTDATAEEPQHPNPAPPNATYQGLADCPQQALPAPPIAMNPALLGLYHGYHHLVAAMGTDHLGPALPYPSTFQPILWDTAPGSHRVVPVPGCPGVCRDLEGEPASEIASTPRPPPSQSSSPGAFHIPVGVTEDDLPSTTTRVETVAAIQIHESHVVIDEEPEGRGERSLPEAVLVEEGDSMSTQASADIEEQIKKGFQGYCQNMSTFRKSLFLSSFVTIIVLASVLFSQEFGKSSTSDGGSHGGSEASSPEEDEEEEPIASTVDLFCGTSWAEASKSCLVPCPSRRNNECPDGETCFSGVSSCHPNPKIPKPFRWCRTTHEEAGDKCGTPCPLGTTAECPEGTRCFEDVKTCHSHRLYCGSSWEDAASKCRVPCPMGNDSNCPGEERCYKDITSCDPNVRGAGTNWCGATWFEANDGCIKACPFGYDYECPDGMKCFRSIDGC